MISREPAALGEYPLPLGQAGLRPQKSRQNSGSMPTPCLGKPVLARNTHDSKARYVTAVSRIAMLAMAENHIKTNRMGMQCGYNVGMNSMRNHRHECAPLSLYKCVTNAQSCIQDHKKQQSQKILRTAVHCPLRAWTSPCLRKGGGGGYLPCAPPDEAVISATVGLIPAVLSHCFTLSTTLFPILSDCPQLPQ